MAINSSCFGYFRSVELFLKRITDIMLDQHNQKQISLMRSKIEQRKQTCKDREGDTIESPSNQRAQTSNLGEAKNDEDLNASASNFESIKIKNPFREMDYLCDSNSESDCEVLNGINMKKMYIMNCYLRFMRLAHIGNGLDIHWRKILDVNVDVSYNQYYEMIEYKTSEILVFMIDCLCILHDVGLFSRTWGFIKD